MHTYYADIVKRIEQPPTWFDECAVPRYCNFTPNDISDVYANECALVLIACQNCGQKFKVAMSSNILSEYQVGNAIREKYIHYGDPPNIGCCGAGPTMNCDDLKVLEFWKRSPESHEWEHQPEFEIELED